MFGGDTCDRNIYVRKEGTTNCSYDSNTCNCKTFDKNDTLTGK